MSLGNLSMVDFGRKVALVAFQVHGNLAVGEQWTPTPPRLETARHRFRQTDGKLPAHGPRAIDTGTYPLIPIRLVLSIKCSHLSSETERNFDALACSALTASYHRGPKRPLHQATTLASCESRTDCHVYTSRKFESMTGEFEYVVRGLGSRSAQGMLHWRGAWAGSNRHRRRQRKTRTELECCVGDPSTSSSLSHLIPPSSSPHLNHVRSSPTAHTTHRGMGQQAPDRLAVPSFMPGPPGSRSSLEPYLFHPSPLSAPSHASKGPAEAQRFHPHPYFLVQQELARSSPPSSFNRTSLRELRNHPSQHSTSFLSHRRTMAIPARAGGSMDVFASAPTSPNVSNLRSSLVQMSPNMQAALELPPAPPVPAPAPPPTDSLHLPLPPTSLVFGLKSDDLEVQLIESVQRYVRKGTSADATAAVIGKGECGCEIPMVRHPTDHAHSLQVDLALPIVTSVMSHSLLRQAWSHRPSRGAALWPGSRRRMARSRLQSSCSRISLCARESQWRVSLTLARTRKSTPCDVRRAHAASIAWPLIVRARLQTAPSLAVAAHPRLLVEASTAHQRHRQLLVPRLPRARLVSSSSRSAALLPADRLMSFLAQASGVPRPRRPKCFPPQAVQSTHATLTLASCVAN